MAENILFKYQQIITAIFKSYKSETTKYIKINYLYMVNVHKTSLVYRCS